MSLYVKMFNVMNDSEAIEKNMEVGTGKNAYKAVSEATILNMIKPLFKKYELIIFPISGDIKDHCMTWDKTDYDGKTSQALRAMTELKVTYRILDVESGEFQDVVGFGNGADTQDKGAGKAFTYSLKNVLSKTFMLFSGEDTDNEHSDDIGKSHKTPQQSKPSTPLAGDKPEKSKVHATLPQIKELEVLASTEKGLEKATYWDFLKKLEVDHKISSQYPMNKEKHIQWTVDDYETIKATLECPF
jgi:hypothetical protein